MTTVESILREAGKLVDLTVQHAPNPDVKLEGGKLVVYLPPKSDPRYLAYLIADALSQANLRFGVQFVARRYASYESRIRAIIRPLEIFILAPLRTRHAYYYARTRLTETIADAIHSLLEERSREAGSRLVALGGGDALGVSIAETLAFYGITTAECTYQPLCSIIDTVGPSNPELQVEKLLYTSFNEYFVKTGKIDVERIYLLKEPGHILLRVHLPTPAIHTTLLYM